MVLPGNRRGTPLPRHTLARERNGHDSTRTQRRPDRPCRQDRHGELRFDHLEDRLGQLHEQHTRRLQAGGPQDLAHGEAVVHR